MDVPFCEFVNFSFYNIFLPCTKISSLSLLFVFVAFAFPYPLLNSEDRIYFHWYFTCNSYVIKVTVTSLDTSNAYRVR